MKVHLACGNRRLDGYVHVDADVECRPDHAAEADALPFDDDSVSLLYFCHGLEHIKKHEVDVVLREFSRVIRPGGVLRLSMPDFHVIAELYLRENVWLARLGCINGGQRNGYDVHYAVYDYEYLAMKLAPHFYDIRLWRPDEVFLQDYDDFSRARINGQLISLNVEAICK